MWKWARKHGMADWAARARLIRTWCEIACLWPWPVALVGTGHGPLFPLGRAGVWGGWWVGLVFVQAGDLENQAHGREWEVG